MVGKASGGAGWGQVLPGRKGKQCRERWHNHLNPDIIKVGGRVAVAGLGTGGRNMACGLPGDWYLVGWTRRCGLPRTASSSDSDLA